MKLIKVFFFMFIISSIICEDCGDISSNDASVDKCKNAKSALGGHCCYYEAPKDTDDKKGCRDLTNYQYDNIKVLVKYFKTFGGKKGDEKDDDAKIDCKSSYIQNSLIILMILLFI